MSAPLRTAALAHYGEMARVGQALASPVRLRLLDLLRQAPRSVDALSAQAHLPIANVSQHLKILKAARIVESERRGQRVEYRISGPDVDAFFLVFRAFGEERLPELERIREEIQGAGPSLTRAELDRLLAENDAVLVDVRPREEHEAGHFPGALSLPMDELEARMDELPKGKMIVTTCRGPYCPMAVEAVALLLAAGFRAAHIDLDAHGAESPGAVPEPPGAPSP